MKRFRSILGIFTIFVLGMIAGACLVFVALRAIAYGPRHAYQQGGGGADGLANLMAWQFSRKLHTDPAQDAQIREILREAAQEIKGVGDRVAPELTESVSKVETRVRAILRPEQQAEFDRMMMKAREGWKKLQARTGKDR